MQKVLVNNPILKSCLHGFSLTNAPVRNLGAPRGRRNLNYDFVEISDNSCILAGPIPPPLPIYPTHYHTSTRVLISLQPDQEGNKLQRPNSNFCKLLKNNSEGCRPSNQVSAAAMTSASDEKWRLFNCFFSRVGLRTFQHPCTSRTCMLQYKDNTLD